MESSSVQYSEPCNRALSSRRSLSLDEMVTFFSSRSFSNSSRILMATRLAFPSHCS